MIVDLMLSSSVTILAYGRGITFWLTTFGTRLHSAKRSEINLSPEYMGTGSLFDVKV